VYNPQQTEFIMASPIPKPPEQRRGRTKPRRGEWQPSPGVGWQHGPIPEPPTGLMPATVAAWEAWFRSWPAAHWGPEHLPQLAVVAKLYDQVERGEFRYATELRYWMDGVGITPKGQQDRRWAPPVSQAAAATPTAAGRDPYAHLRIVPGK
jgi:hypothetical protein